MTAIPQPAVVADASLMVKLVLAERHTAEARALFRAWEQRNIRILAPSWFACEVANVLYQRRRRGQLTLQAAKLALRGILVEVVLTPENALLAERALEMAEDLGLPAPYDTQYAALAESEACELWTADERFWNAARGRFPWVRWLGEQV